MLNNQVLVFIGKCLTLGLYPERTEEIRRTLKNSDFSWEYVVYAASNQYVLTAWFVQMLKTNLSFYFNQIRVILFNWPVCNQTF